MAGLALVDESEYGAYLDAHYTPKSLAAALVRSAEGATPALIADLAVGGGDLLLEAERVWPEARFLATDIDTAALQRLRRLRPSWNIGQCDLRNATSRARCRVLQTLKGSVSLLLLNPPFTCRGGTRFDVDTPAGSLQASTALSFLLIASQYVSESGEIVAILPVGCLYNIKDEEAWRFLRAKYRVTVLGHSGKGSFPLSAASTALVSFSPIRAIRELDSAPSIPSAGKEVSASRLRVRIVRGCCPVHRSGRLRSKPRLVHYTDLHDATVHLNGRRGAGDFRCVAGPAVLIPRVGSITLEKVALFEASEAVMLSDCVIALKTESRAIARKVRRRLVDHFNLLRAEYVGTGAPFITMNRLQAVLERVGISVDAQ